MSDLKVVALGDCVRPVKTWNPLKVAGEDEFTYIDLSAVDQERKQIVEARNVACAEAPSRARQLVEAGDVLVSTVRPNLNGVARVGVEHHGATASTGFCVLRPVAEKLDGGYAFQWVKSPNFVADMVSKATGASYPAVSDRIILESRLPLPPLPEQRRIAAMLDQADALRAKRREALDDLDELEESHFEAFLNDTAATHVDCSLIDLAEKHRGSFVNGPFGSDLLTSELQETGVPVVYIRDIRNGDYQRVSDVCVSERKARDLAVCEVRPGDVLVAKVGDPPGTAAVYPSGEPTAVVTQDVIRIRPNLSVVRPEFLRAYLNSSVGRWQIASITVEATRARISLGDFKKLIIRVPPVGDQEKFMARVQAINSQRRRMAASLAELNSLFASLQHSAFTGQL